MRPFFTLFVLCILVSCKEDAKEPVSMKTDVFALADDSMVGRETGTDGELKAANYLIQRFQDLGLEAKGSEGYLQAFSFKASNNPHQAPEIIEAAGDGLTTGRNVVAYMNNEAETTVVIGAHYDHLGMGAEGSLFREGEAIHNGADDNASGVALMLNLVDKLKIQKSQNYLFIAFSGEELGLLGSNYFVKNPTIDLDKVSYMINMDMVGRLNEENTVAIHGVGTSPIFKQTLFANNDQGLNIAESESGIGPSDHTSFYLSDIPVLHFFTGQHEDYHKPGDDAEKLNYEGMQKISSFIMNIIIDLSDDGTLAFRKTKNESEEVPTFKVGLGVVPDYLFTGEGMRIDGISEDRPAQKAGLIKGDVVKKLGDSLVTDMMSYMRALATYEVGQKTKVAIERAGEIIEVEIEF